MQFRRASDVIYDVLDGHAVLLDPSATKMLTLNPVGTLVWRHLDDDRTCAELVTLIIPLVRGVTAEQLGDRRHGVPPSEFVGSRRGDRERRASATWDRPDPSILRLRRRVREGAGLSAPTGREHAAVARGAGRRRWAAPSATGASVHVGVLRRHGAGRCGRTATRRGASGRAPLSASPPDAGHVAPGRYIRVRRPTRRFKTSSLSGSITAGTTWGASSFAGLERPALRRMPTLSAPRGLARGARGSSASSANMPPPVIAAVTPLVDPRVR